MGRFRPPVKGRPTAAIASGRSGIKLSRMSASTDRDPESARSRAYRWGEDGLAGISDRRQYVCFALALWNGKDPILKERLFGASGTEGNHGEDVKEVWFHLDATPTHSFMRMLYKYPQAEYPYARLADESRRRTKRDPELELVDTGAFDGDRYFDVFVAYAKASTEFRVDYEPAESRTGLFGGNSNWRGPVWVPVDFLLIESLQKYHHFFGDSLKVEFPTGSGNLLDLWDVAAELSRRLTRIFLRGEDGRRPVYGGAEKFQTDEHFRDYVLFYEYFHGDDGAGLGASHQTGWTGLVAKLLQQSGDRGNR